MFRCPFCQSDNCKELSDTPAPYTYSQNQPFGYYQSSYNDDLTDILCMDCGIVTKIHPNIYDVAHKKEQK